MGQFAMYAQNKREAQVPIRHFVCGPCGAENQVHNIDTNQKCVVCGAETSISPHPPSERIEGSYS